MKISIAWLNEWVSAIPDNLSSKLTMLGLEVDSESLAAPYFTGVIVGEVLEVTPHPDADKLRIAIVNIGQKEPLQIVCGAPNVAKGIKVPTAVIGAILPGDFAIKPTKLRGVDSAGMLCSARELGLSDDHEGLMILDSSFEVGADFRVLYDLDDTILEVDLTPNRGDCLSVIGIARDIALSTTNAIFTERTQEKQLVSIDAKKLIVVEEKAACPRYLGRMIIGLNPNAPTPLWMSERLRRSGIRPHGILVNITNYILLELGQPLHAFDANKIEGDINVRFAKKDEAFTILKGDKLALKEDALVICDAKGIIALAGVMGGENSACNDKTVDLFLESAWFNPLTIAGKARDYGLHTDASHRYERGVDFELPEKALEYATELLITLAGGKAGPISRAEEKNCLPMRENITVNFAKVNAVIGFEYSKEEIISILSRIGEVVEKNENSITINIPSFRFDLIIEEDLIEEIARIHGYDNVPVRQMRSMLAMPTVSESKTPLNRIKATLVDRDYVEAITMSFVKPEWQKILDPEYPPIALKNPISAELSVMRTLLLPGLLGALDYNLKRQQKRIRLFESGLTFKGTLEHCVQEAYIGGVICGDSVSPQWGVSARKVDFFDIKGDIEALLNLSGKQGEFSFVTKELPPFHPGQSAEIINKDGLVIGYIGKLHPTIAKTLDINAEVFVFELRIDALQTSTIPKFGTLSKFPTSRRDLALTVPNDIQVGDVINRIFDKKHELLYSVSLFDIYHGDSEKAPSRSMAFSLTFQDEKENLKDEQIDTIIECVLNDLRASNIFLRQ